MRNGLFVGLIGACISGVFAFLAVLLRDVLSDPHQAISYSYVGDALFAALIVGLTGGLIVGLLNGWLAYIRHKVLRLLLSKAGVIPANYAGFLDEATARVLLRKVGGSYMFVHPLLRDYFAEAKGNRAGTLAVDLEHPYRLIFEPVGDPLPRKPDGGLDWTAVTVIRVLGVEDYHD